MHATLVSGLSRRDEARGVSCLSSLHVVKEASSASLSWLPSDALNTAAPDLYVAGRRACRPAVRGFTALYPATARAVPTDCSARQGSEFFKDGFRDRKMLVVI